ncbi:hypothetical protein FGO68_gene16934 [Halteria grandinella]|uniref:Uncharacterized protein n=1 Tax=Halteria grandinella TaxID=5974 RepID=A0A8J8NF62_HALGN|nr:hypothetical protein FGO68_gene16934 [Halteria grandinella]
MLNMLDIISTFSIHSTQSRRLINQLRQYSQQKQWIIIKRINNKIINQTKLQIQKVSDQRLKSESKK